MEGYSGIVVCGNMEMPVDDYLKMVKKQKDQERMKKRREKNTYGFPESDKDENNSKYFPYNQSRQQNQFNCYSEEDYAGNNCYPNEQRNNKVDPFASAGGPKRNSRRNDKFDSQNKFKNEDYQNSQSYSQQYGSTSSSDAFSRPNRNPFGSNNGYDNEDYQQPQSYDQHYAFNSSSDAFPRAKRERFESQNGFNNEDFQQSQSYSQQYGATSSSGAFSNSNIDLLGLSDGFNNEDYQQPQNYNQQYGSTSSSGAFPRAKKDPFGSQNGFNNEDYQQPQSFNQQYGSTSSSGTFPRAKKDLFGSSEYNNDIYNGQQQQRTRGNPFGEQNQQNRYPKAKKKDPFSRSRGFNDDEDDDDY